MPRGVHFAITDEQVTRLREAEDDDALGEVIEEIEEAWEHVFETDKGWDALHRCFSGGTLVSEEGDMPLARVFFGGEVLNEEDDYFVVLVTPDQVRELAAALAHVTPAWLRKRYFDLEFPGYQGEKSEEDFAYTLDMFEGMPAFFAEAAKAGRHVVFTVSQ